ncbi:hypothetical protein EBR43_12935, partial [bacterium]|nr:hypothetical protein [bacterium]
MKFLDIVQSRFKTIQEQTPGEAPVLPVNPAAAPAPVPGPEQTTPTPLSPEGEVFLVRLLRKALFMNP